MQTSQKKVPAIRGEKALQNSNRSIVQTGQPDEIAISREARCLQSSQNIQSSEDLRNLMAAMIEDLAFGRIHPKLANSISTAARNLINLTELELKYGDQAPRAIKLRMASK